MLFTKTGLVYVILTIYSSAAFADDACTTIAKEGLYDTHISKSSTQTYSQFKSNFCSWYSSYRESHSGGSAGATIPISDIPIGFNGTMTFGEADAMQSGLCSAQSGSNSDQVVWSDVTHYVDPSAAQAFTDCVKATHGGLAVTPNLNDEETFFTLSIVYHPPDGANPTTITQVSTKGWICPTPENGGVDLRNFVNKPGQFSNSQIGLVCQRDVKTVPFVYGGIQVVVEPAMISVLTNAGSYTQFFRAKVFQDPLADGAKVLASYPKGTILPFAGHLENIPAGWHLCDGHNGTVNLVKIYLTHQTNSRTIEVWKATLTNQRAFWKRSHTSRMPTTA